MQTFLSEWLAASQEGLCLPIKQVTNYLQLLCSNYSTYCSVCRSQWPRSLRPNACWDRGFESHRGHGCLSCKMLVLSGRGLCDVPIPRPEESYRLWCVSECEQVKINILDTCCEQVGRREKDYERKCPVSNGISISLDTSAGDPNTRPTSSRLLLTHWYFFKYKTRPGWR
jgi:hypothetical protein